jgi:hypothetical protein
MLEGVLVLLLVLVLRWWWQHVQGVALVLVPQKER